jgi:3-methyladenine DNA glycosylase AlkD
VFPPSRWETKYKPNFDIIDRKNSFKTMSDLYTAIVSELKKHADNEGAEMAKHYHKYEGYESYGIQTPIVRKLLKRYKKNIQKLNCEKAFALARKFFISHIEEEVLAGNYVLQLKNDCLIPSKFGYLDEVLDHFRSWSAIDDFCVEGGKVFQPLLLRYPKETVALLRKWNKSKNMWKRRASVVPFTRKVGESGAFTKEGLELCKNLVWDKEDLVQKAVGWALKDMMRGDKQKVLDYVKKIRRDGVASTIALYAIRDLSGKERQEILDKSCSYLPGGKLLSHKIKIGFELLLYFKYGQCNNQKRNAS